MAIKDFYTTISPTLDLDFSGSCTIDPRISFSRSGTGSIASYFDEKGVMNFAPSNVPRIDFDPVTGECKGLLIEEQRTNLLKYSEQFDNAAWTKTNTTVTANAITAPDGTVTADKLIEDTSTLEHYVRSNGSAQPAGTYTASVFYNISSERDLYLRVVHIGDIFNTSQVTFYKASKTLGTHSGLAVDAKAQDVGNGWWRISLTFTTTATRTIQHGVQSNTGVYTGDGTSGLYIWGAQLEQGSFPTSYIPTTSAQVTRAADAASLTGANFYSWYKQDEGTFFAEYIIGADNSSSCVIYAYDGTTSDNSISMRYTSDSQAQYSVNSSGINQVNLSTLGYSKPVRYKRAVTYTKDSFQQGINGVLPSSEATNGEVPLVTTIIIGAEDTAGGNSINGHICRIAYYPERLSNINLQALTT